MTVQPEQDTPSTPDDQETTKPWFEKDYREVAKKLGDTAVPEPEDVDVPEQNGTETAAK